MKKRVLFACACMFAGSSGYATTWHWKPTLKDAGGKYQWNSVSNWVDDADGVTRGYPHNGDTAILGEKSTDMSYNVCNSDVNGSLQEVRFAKGVCMNQGNVVLLAGGKGIQYLDTAGFTGNWMGAYLVEIGRAHV